MLRSFSAGTLAFLLILSGTAFAADPPIYISMEDMKNYPNIKDFDKSLINETNVNWDFRKGNRDSGANVAKDCLVPDDRVLLDYEYNETSRFGSEGDVAKLLVLEKRGNRVIPKGVRVGVRLEPGGIGGGGSSFKGFVKMKYVNYKDWKKVYNEKYDKD